MNQGFLPALCRASAAICLGIVCALPAQAVCFADNKPGRGVNLAGAEFNGDKLPGTLFKDYTYPTRNDLRYFAELGVNTIRMPFRWERLQRTINSALDTSELSQISRVAGDARELGLCVILDAHNFGTYARQPLGTSGVPLSAFRDFWLRMHDAFSKVDNVAFGLMNEPAHAASRAAWAQAAQDTLTALRNAGSRHWVLVSGAGWSGAHDWTTRSNGFSNAEAFAGLRDPLRRSALEVHQYADSDSSGTHSDCVGPERMRIILDRVRQWAVDNQQQLFLGEFGVSSSAACLLTLQSQLDATRERPWIGWTYWAAGGWWPPTYPFSVHPITGTTRAQLPLLRQEWRNLRD